jgi:transposase
MFKRLIQYLESYVNRKAVREGFVKHKSSGAEMNNKRREEQIKFEDLCK